MERRFNGQDYKDAFRDYGIDFDEQDADQASQLIRESAIKNTLVRALDDWYRIELQAAEFNPFSRSPLFQMLLQTARQADRDPWRDRLRDAIQRNDESALLNLASSEDILDQPPATIALLSSALQTRKLFDKAIPFLRQAQLRHPADYWLNFELAECLQQATPAQLAEAIVYRRAALSLRPDSPHAYNYLAVALGDAGNLDEAEAVLRRGMQVAPTFYMNHYNLYNLLIRRRKQAEAAAVLLAAPKPGPDDRR